MKPILIILALFVGSSLFAQKFEIGLNGGMVFNTAPSIPNSPAPFYTMKEKPSQISAAASLKALNMHKKWQYGIEIACMPLSYKISMGRYYLIDSQIVKVFGKDETTSTLSKPAIPVKAIFDRVVVLKKLKVYGGISAGYVFVTNTHIPHSEFGTDYITPQGHGITVGLHTGGTYLVSKRTGINAEVSADYMLLTIGGVSYNLFAFPFTFGIRYRIN